MTEHCIPFNKLQWEHPAKGVAQKIHINGNQQLRLLRFSDGFFEANWCTKDHVGFVLEGEMKINFNGQIKHYKKGDGLWIEAGETSRHKVIMEKEGSVQLILFETVV